ncbi:MAG: HPF/RaiA family ribosome-associated protein [Candidatus Omnitrophota bacterium]
MKIDISFKYLDRSDYIDTVLGNNFKKIERKVKIFRKNDPVHISVHLEKNPNKEQYFCRSHIYLPSSKVLAAVEKSSDCSIAINKTFAALNRQLGKEKYKLENRRGKRRETIRQLTNK